MKQALKSYDLAVVGGGIVGLAHAYTAAKAGLRVVLFERNAAAVGATIRNFGMVWPIGQPVGKLDRALRARNCWLELAEVAGFWAKPWGSLHLAYAEDELAVLEEFVSSRADQGYQVEMLTPEQTLRHSRAVKDRGLRGALFSRTEVNVDPRQATHRLHAYLRSHMGVDIFYHTCITEVRYPELSDGRNRWRAGRIIVAGGNDLATLYPDLLQAAPLVQCKLQMMRTAPQPGAWELGPNLAAGLTLQHYASFAHCPSLPKLKQRFRTELSEHLQWGIHVMVSQTSLGELTIGDSHEYGPDPSPFDRRHINQLILDYLATFARAPDLRIAETWHGVYAKMTNGATELVLEPEPGVAIVTGLGGAGMTLSFGLAEEIIHQRYPTGKQVALAK